MSKMVNSCDPAKSQNCKIDDLRVIYPETTELKDWEQHAAEGDGCLGGDGNGE